MLALSRSLMRPKIDIVAPPYVLRFAIRQPWDRSSVGLRRIAFHSSTKSPRYSTE
jgi:hypothetical protein